MGKITLCNSIERPIDVVQNAVLEGFSVHKNNGDILVFSHSMDEYLHYAEFNTATWSENLSDISLSIQLNNRDGIDHTYIHSTIKYRGNTKFFVSSVIQKVILRQQIRMAASIRLQQFKYRLEKWL